jgi:hypothetical protein
MKKKILVSVAASIAFMTMTATSALAYDKTPPFKLDKLKKFVKVEANGNELRGYEPKNDYNIFVNYELGMHCVGFSMDYCCIIPPYNSIQAQAVRGGKEANLPKLLSPDDDVKLYYYTRDNSYSEGNKMKYFSVPKDADGDGHFDSPNDTVANYVWTHLFIYADLEGTKPAGATDKDRLRVGRQIPQKN